MELTPETRLNKDVRESLTDLIIEQRFGEQREKLEDQERCYAERAYEHARRNSGMVE